MSKRFFLALSLIGFAAACGTEQAEQQIFASALKDIRGLAGPAQSRLTTSQIRQRLTPEVRAQLGGAPLMIAELEKQNLASILVQAAVNRDVTTYLTPDGISVSLQHGVVVGTRGLGFDLMTADVAEVHVGLHSGARAVRVHRYLDGEEQIVIASFVCDYAGEVEITEMCYGNDSQFTNSYTMSAGRVIGSRQWIGPQVGYLRLEPS